MGTLQLSVYQIKNLKMKKYLLLVAGLFLFLAACKKEEDESTATLKVTPRHHGRAIDSCTIYLKYNATDVPANGKYDDSAVCVQVGGIPVATFSGLKKGNYYVFGHGWDAGWTPPSPVRGGFAYPLTGEPQQTLDLAVSEY